MKPPVPFLAVFAVPRSGSNHFFDLLAARTGVLSLNEYFGRLPNGLSRDVRKASLVPFGSWEAFTEAAERNPVETLAFLADYPDVEIAAIKIQPRHLANLDNVKQLISAAAGSVFLRRNPLSIWISRRIVEESRAWAFKNTEEYLVPFEPNAFCVFTRNTLRRMRDFESICDEIGAPKWRLSYHEIQAFGRPQDMWTALTSVFPHIPSRPMLPEPKPQFERQDARPPFARLSNPDDARSWLASAGLDYLIENNDEFDPQRVIESVDSFLE